jgi:hypothetical protein
MPRRTTDALQQDAQQALLDALTELGVDARVATDPRRSDDGPDFLVDVGGVTFAVEAKSLVTGADRGLLARRFRGWGLPGIVVADRIAGDAKAAMRKFGLNYFDRRGELRIVAPPLIIDTIVPGVARSGGVPAGPLTSQVAKEVAIASLLTPDRPHGVREMAAYIERAPSAVSNAMAQLREDGLLTSRGEPVVPDLFHELAAVWRRSPFPLADLPKPGAAPVNRQLDLGLDEPESTTGWALTDTVAAASWGMPIVARGDYPPDFYVPSDSVVRRARALLGDAETAEGRACTVAVAPVRLVCRKRLDHARSSGELWPVANHIVVALDIVQDRARGAEILDSWHPEGIVRAW